MSADGPTPETLRAHPLLAAFRDAVQAPIRIDDVHLAALADPQTQITVDELFGAFFTSSPGWLSALLRFRNAVVSRLGFETGDHTEPTIPDRVEPGNAVGTFTVLERSDDEIVFGGDDRHMALRISVARSGDDVSIATAAHERSSIGRAYLGLVRPFHRRIAAIVVRRCAAAVATPEQ